MWSKSTYIMIGELKEFANGLRERGVKAYQMGKTEEQVRGVAGHTRFQMSIRYPRCTRFPLLHNKLPQI